MLKRLDGGLAVLVGAGVVISVLGLLRVLDGRPEPALEARPEEPRHVPDTGQVVEPPPVASAAVLFSVVPGPEGCSWEVRELPELVPSVLRVTDGCPDDVLWIGRPGESDLIYERDGSLIRIAASGEVEPIALPQGSEAFGRLVHFWIDEESARLRVGFLAEIPCVLVDGQCTYEVEGRSIRSERDADGWEDFVMRDGWAAVHAGEARWSSLPSWGTRGVALAYESDPVGGWTMVSAAPTRFEAGDTPGLAVLDISEAPVTVSLNRLRAATTCLGHRRASTGCERYGGAVPPWFARELEDEFDEVGSLSFDGGAWIFPIAYGDVPHIAGPVFLECGPACEPAPLNLPTTDVSPLSLSVRGPYLLAGREQRLIEGAVFTPGSAEPILALPPAASSVWLPQ